MEVYIKKLTPDQFEESAQIIRRSFQTVADEFGFTVETTPTNGAFLQPEKLAADYQKGIAMFGLYENGHPAGFMALERSDDEHRYYLEKLSVMPEFRHKGYGKRLLDYAKSYVRQQQGNTLSIAMIDENTRLKVWYLEYGFIPTSVKQYDHLPFTVCFMSMGV